MSAARVTQGLGVGLLAAAGRLARAAAQAPQGEPVTAYGAVALWQTGLGLLLVLALIFACAWLLRRFGWQPQRGQGLLKVQASVMVGQRERVVLVALQDTWLVLGVAPGQVRMLHTLPSPAAAPSAEGETAAAALGTGGPFADRLRAALQRWTAPQR